MYVQNEMNNYHYQVMSMESNANIGSWVGPRAGLEAVENNLLSMPGIEPRPSSP
jgi:hypothetical protein